MPARFAAETQAPMEHPLTRHTHLQSQWLGQGVPYPDGMNAMRACMAKLQATIADADAEAEMPVGQLLFLEHQATVTVTRQGGLAHLRVSPAELQHAGIALVETDRGGDVTFHGPGQLVGYPVVALHQEASGRANLTGYLRALEAGLLSACESWGIRGAHRKEGMTGIWIAHDPDSDARHFENDERAAKLIAIGVGVRQGITRHGFALNVTTDLERFTDRIVPCGLQGRPVTSLQRLAENGRFTPPLGFRWATADADLHAHFAQHIAAALGVRSISALSERSCTAQSDLESISQRQTAAPGFRTEGERLGTSGDEENSSNLPSSSGEIVSHSKCGAIEPAFLHSSERM